MREAVAEALEALLDHKAQDSRTLEIALEGAGERTVRVGFVAEAPLWKTAYRLVLLHDSDEALMQGWAVLENMTGHDWEAVQVTLLSGNPVTFRQSLYESYYVAHPEIPVEVFGRVLPRKDEGGVVRPQPVPAAPPAAFARLERQRAATSMDGMTGGAAGGVLAVDAAETRPSGSAVAVQSEVATAQVIYPFPRPIALADGESAMLPLVNRAIPAERIALYQPETHARHPLAAVSLSNNGDAPLPPGIVTLFEAPGDNRANRFLGDAELSYLPAGDERMVTFALDQDVTIDRDRSDAQSLVRASIANGLLRFDRQQRQTTVYTIANASELPRKVILEIPRRSGWRLQTGEAWLDVELTETHHRLPVEVAANETVTQEVVATRPSAQSYTLLTVDARRIGVYARSPELPDRLRQALEEIGKRKAAVETLRADLRRLEAETRDITGDQSRLRENLASVPRGSDLSRRYLATLAGQEDRLDQIRTAKSSLLEQIAAAEKELRRFVEDIDI